MLPEKELVKLKRRCLVSVEPHCIACRLPQLVPDGAGHQGHGQTVHLLATHPGEEKMKIPSLKSAIL